jgi:hypothetical protein
MNCVLLRDILVWYTPLLLYFGFYYTAGSRIVYRGFNCSASSTITRVLWNHTVGLMILELLQYHGLCDVTCTMVTIIPRVQWYHWYYGLTGSMKFWVLWYHDVYNITVPYEWFYDTTGSMRKIISVTCCDLDRNFRL